MGSKLTVLNQFLVKSLNPQELSRLVWAPSIHIGSTPLRPALPRCIRVCHEASGFIWWWTLWDDRCEFGDYGVETVGEGWL